MPAPEIVIMPPVEPGAEVGAPLPLAEGVAAVPDVPGAAEGVGAVPSTPAGGEIAPPQSQAGQGEAAPPQTAEALTHRQRAANVARTVVNALTYQPLANAGKNVARWAAQKADQDDAR